MECSCPWCDCPASRSVSYAHLDLVFPICNNASCKTELDQFIGNSAILITGDIAGSMQDQVLLRRINKLKEYVRMQR